MDAATRNRTDPHEEEAASPRMPDQRDSERNGLASLLAWLVVTHQPSVIVELAQGDTDCLLAAGDTIEGLARGATYTAVTKQSESESLAALASSSPIELLHLSLLESSDGPLPHLEGWFELMSPGAIVVTSGASTEGSHFMRTKQMVSDRFPSISVGFGSLAEALVAQAPIDGSTPVIELLRDYRPGTRDLAVVELDAADLVTDESPSELAVKNFVAAVLEHQQAEREAFLAALRAYKDLTSRLSLEVAASQRLLADQRDEARNEREHLVSEFLDRIDVLSAKISTSASRYTSELADKDRALEEQQRELLSYAGRAANAESVIADMYQSRSWRLTAPVRLLTRVRSRLHAARADGAES
jgi:hypothetical protein